MLTQGVHPDVIENLTVEQSVVLWQAWVDGVYGDFGRARESHVLYSMLHNLTNVLINVNSKSKTNKKPDGFDKLYPELWEFVGGNQQEEKSISAQEVWQKLGMMGELPGG